MRIVSALIIALTLVTIGCAHNGTSSAGKATTAKSADAFGEGSTLYTLTNLHPDPAKNQLYTANFLMPGLIPRCTAVVVKDLSKKRLVFTANGVDYRFDLNPRSTPEGFDANMKLYFGPHCDKGAVSQLSAVDQKGIKEGRASVGMSKKGIIYAIGYPPNSPTTPNTDAPVWKYFHNRFNTVNVNFTNGVVSSIKD